MTEYQETSVLSGSQTSMRILVEEFKKLPGISLKAAQKLSYSILSDPKLRSVLKNIIDISGNIAICPQCGSFMQSGSNCGNCAEGSDVICVVASYSDMSAIERSGCFHGSFHLLGGLIAPLENVLPENLRIAELHKRAESAEEILLALPFSIEGDATALYIKDVLADCNVKISRIARGLPAGAAPDVLDRKTVSEAFTGKIYLN